MKYFFAIVFLFFSLKGGAQPVTDSLRRLDSLRGIDMVQIPVAAPVRTAGDTIRPVLLLPFTSDSFLYRKRLFFSFTNPLRYTISEKPWQGKEIIFYSIVALLLFFAFIKNNFSRYLADMYSSYFRTTLRQRQVKEQLLQSPLPSLLFNIFFVVSAAVFLSLIFTNFKVAIQIPFWLMAAYCAIGIVFIYAGKFLVLKLFGWVFQMPEATDSYIFVVFSTNKILGVLLLPFTILLAFTSGSVNGAAITVSLFVVGFLFIYRYFLSFISVSQLVNINLFHFLIYLAAFEILPVLLINKLLFTIIRELS